MRIRRRVVVTVLVALVSLALPFWLLTSRSPVVMHAPAATPSSLSEIRALMRQYDPRRWQADQPQQISLPVRLLHQSGDWLAGQMFGGRGAASLEPAGLHFQLALPLHLPGGLRYLNLQATLRSGDGPPQWSNVRAGKLPLPSPLFSWLLDRAADKLGHAEDWHLLQAAVQTIGVDADRQNLVIDLVWNPQILRAFQLNTLPETEWDTIRSVHTELGRQLATAPLARTTLLEFLLPLMTAGDSNDARLAQQRASLLVLAAYLAERRLETIIPDAHDWPELPKRKLTLGGRHDSAQHFIVSAAIAAWTNQPVAEILGTLKELEDVRAGSGFSFTDIAADRAGTHFGQWVASAPTQLDAQLRKEVKEADLFPALTDLPEFMQRKEFKRRFGGPGSPAYNAKFAEIDQRIAALPLFRALEGSPSTPR